MNDFKDLLKKEDGVDKSLDNKIKAVKIRHERERERLNKKHQMELENLQKKHDGEISRIK